MHDRPPRDIQSGDGVGHSKTVQSINNTPKIQVCNQVYFYIRSVDAIIQFNQSQEFITACLVCKQDFYHTYATAVKFDRLLEEVSQMNEMCKKMCKKTKTTQSLQGAMGKTMQWGNPFYRDTYLEIL